MYILAHYYPDWLQHDRLKYPLLFGSISSSPLAVWEGEATSGDLATSLDHVTSDDLEFYIGDGEGDIFKLKTSSGTLKEISKKPRPNPDCGKAKDVKVRRNGNVLIAWEKCLLEQKGIYKFILFGFYIIHFYIVAMEFCNIIKIRSVFFSYL